MKTYVLMLILMLLAAPVSAQEWAQEQLDDSPRHHEWVEVSSNGRSVHSFVAHPESDENALAVIVIHENRGLTDWVRSFADQLAAAGYLAIAPDLLSDFDAEHSRTNDFESSDAARDALYQLDPEQITSDLEAVQDYVSQLPSSSGTVAVMGFCWGGSQTFRYATNASDLAAALVFYGSAPEAEEHISNIAAPVYGFYAEDDQRINATIPETEQLMEEHGKTYEYEIYDGVGHAFMRRADSPDRSPQHEQAREEAWQRIEQILSQVE